MITLTAVTLILNGLMLMMVLAALLVLTVFLQDEAQQRTRYFAGVLITLMVWSIGSFVARTTGQVTDDVALTTSGVRAIELGFGATCIAMFLLASSMANIRSPAVFLAASIGTGMAIIYRLILFALDVNLESLVDTNGLVTYSFPTINRWVYFGFAVSTLALAWRNSHKFRRNYIGLAFILMSLSHVAVILSPRLRVLGVAEIITSLAVMVIAYGIVQIEVIDPFVRRKRQVEIIQDVGVAITNLHVDKVLEAIAERAASLLDARGSAVYLNEQNWLVLSAVHNLPESHVGTLRIQMGQGTVGEIAQQRRPILLNHYWREMHGKPHEGFPIEAVGAIAGVPLLLGNDVVGVLIVTESRDRNAFAREQVERLRLIAPQAAVTIRNNRLLEHERDLKQRLLAQQTQLQTVLTSTSNPVLAIGRDFRILFVNPAAQELLGIASRPSYELDGQNLLDIVDTSLLPSDWRTLLRTIRRQGFFVYDLSHNKQDYLCLITPLMTAPLETRPRGWVIVLNNVTSLKEVDRLKSQMIRMTTHDLKNPLFALQNYIELIEEDGEALFDENMQHNIAMVWVQIDRMKQLITGILNLERVQEATVFTEVDLHDTLTAAVYGVQGLAQSKNITVVLDMVDELPPIQGDAQHILQAITNLLDNAIKFTPNGGRIEISAQIIGAQVVMNIVDNGIGIPEADQSKIFDRFFRGERGRSKNDASSGLGLSLVKAVIEQHHGEITLNSSENQGTTFTVRLPIENELPIATS